MATALPAGTGLAAGSVTLAIALGIAGLVLLLVVLGLTLLAAGVAQQLQVAAAVGAGAHNLLAPPREQFAAVFLVLFGLHTDPGSIPPVLLPALALAVGTTSSSWWSSAR